MTDAEGNVVGAVEVHHTHAVGSCKAAALTGAGLRWCEATAKRILDAVRYDKWEVHGVTCGMEICFECADKIRQEEFARLDEIRMTKLRRQSALREDHEQVLRTREHDNWSSMNVSADQSNENEEETWRTLRDRVISTLLDEAKKCGYMTAPSLTREVDRMMGDDVLIGFGKYRQRTLSEVATLNWKYVLWLAGYEWGRMDGTRAIRRDPNGIGVEHIPTEIEDKAREFIQGKCLKCKSVLHNENCTWKTLCKGCYCSLSKCY